MSDLLRRAAGRTIDTKSTSFAASLNCRNSFLATEDIRSADYVSDTANQSSLSADNSVCADTNDTTDFSLHDSYACHADTTFSDSEISNLSVSSDEEYTLCILGNVQDPATYLTPTRRQSPDPIEAVSPSPGYVHFESPVIGGYSPQQAGYLRGQYAFPSPSPSLSADVLPNNDTRIGNGVLREEISITPFSMDAILESSTHSSALPDTPAQIVSALCTFLNNDTPYYDQTSSNWSSDDRNQSPSTTTTSSTTSSSRDTLYWCHACDDVCSGREDAESHQFLHTADDASCRLRPEIFRQQGYITCHEEIRNFNRIKCGLCDRILANRFFSKHMRTHERHSCGRCYREFPSSTRLSNHVLEHTISRPGAQSPISATSSPRSYVTYQGRRHVQCSFCGLQCRSKHACAVHEQRHVDRKPYACAVPGCAKSFTQSIQLRLHQRFHNTGH